MGRRTVRILISIPQEIYEILEEAKNELMMTRSTLLRVALLYYLGKEFPKILEKVKEGRS